MRMLQFLQSHPLFRGVPEDELKTVSAKMETIIYQPGELIIREGDPGLDCQIITEGTAQVYTRNLIGRTVLLAELGAGHLIGEISLLRNEKRTANIRARTEVKVLLMQRDVFEQLSRSSRLFHESLQISAEIRYVHRLLRRASLWSSIPDSELRGLAEITIRRQVKRGDIIVRQGDDEQQLYMVTQGRFEARSNGKRIAVFSEGDCFGDIELLTEVSAGQTVIALEDSEILVMGRSEFQFVLLQYPLVLGQFAQIVRLRRPELPLSASYQEALRKQDELDGVQTHKAVRHRAHRDIFAGRWVDILFTTGALFIITTVLAAVLPGTVWDYIALFIGALVGPVSFVAYMRDSQLFGFRLSRLLLVFVLSAILALPIAWGLEVLILNRPTTPHMLAGVQVPLSIALIEEVSKLLVILFFFRTKQFRFLMDAIVFGATAGMGFAAIETILYGWSQLAQASTGDMLVVVWMRALLSPFGHGTWTAIAAAGIWYMTLRSVDRYNLKARPVARWGYGLGLPLIAIGLHTMWNYPFATGILHLLVLLMIGAVGILLLGILVYRGRAQEQRALMKINPDIEDIYESEMDDVSDESKLTSRTKTLLICEACATQSPSYVRYCARCGHSLRLLREG